MSVGGVGQCATEREGRTLVDIVFIRILSCPREEEVTTELQAWRQDGFTHLV